MIISSAEPFFIPGGPIGVLLVHGFTGTPKEMRWMGEFLAGKGYSVLAPRLAGHATQLEDMNHVRWQDWLHSVEDGYHLLKGTSDKIVIAGLSMGGVLSLIFAANYEVNGVIAMSTPYELPSDPRVKLLPLLWRIIPNVPKGESDWQDPTPVKDHVDYPFYPTKGITQLNALMTEMQTALPKISVPALLIHSRKDGGVPFENMEKIAAQIGGQDVTTIAVENSGHVIVRDLEKENVFEAAYLFLNRICGPLQT